jgi:hypothetical protein
MALKILTFLLLSLAFSLLLPAARAQVPPHAPGTICFTATFWCWAVNPGLPGQSCYCLDRDNNPTAGVLG